MKKIIALILCLTLILCVCACTDNKNENESTASGEISLQESLPDGAVELPDVIVKPNDGNSSSSDDPDSSVSSDGSVSSPSTDGGNSGEQSEPGSSGTADGGEGSTEPYDPSEGVGIELPEYEF